jgi:hypothetical protein
MLKKNCALLSLDVPKLELHVTKGLSLRRTEIPFSLDEINGRNAEMVAL